MSINKQALLEEAMQDVPEIHGGNITIPRELQFLHFTAVIQSTSSAVKDTAFYPVFCQVQDIAHICAPPERINGKWVMPDYAVVKMRSGDFFFVLYTEAADLIREINQRTGG